MSSDPNLTRANAEMVRMSLASARQARALKHYRRVRVLTDDLLDYLERLNLRYPEGRELDEATREVIGEVMGQLPEAWRLTVSDSRTIQEALDQVFELKNEIRRQVMPDGYPAGWDWDG